MVLNQIEGGPISDIKITNGEDEEIVALDLGYRPIEQFENN
jgi:hypothetical protein